ncbi:MAG: TIGR01906 family membrane protein [Chloroflexi bacterium]|nr:TIGR01906 family membrane protein [Chloroflexota bacterium]
MGLFRALLIGLFILSIPVTLITTNIRVAISEQRVYDYSVRNFDAAEVSGIPESELIGANGEIRDYLTSGDGALSITVTNNLGERESLFNVRETAHMADVRDLVRAVFTVQVLVMALVLFLAVVMLVLWPPRALAASALYGSVLTAGTLGIVGLVAISGFDSAWSQFHVIAFSNDFWQLDPRSDHLIQMFPESFWQQITLLIGAMILLEALIIAGVSAIYLMLSRPKGQPVDRPHRDVAGGPGHGRHRVSQPDPPHVVR